MLSEEIQDIILYNNDLNAKMFLLVVLAAYMIYAFWKFEKLGKDEYSNKIYKIGLFIYSRITLFFFPLMVVTLLHMNTTLEEMIIVLTGFYSIIFVFTFGILFVKGMEYVLNLLGITKGDAYK